MTNNSEYADIATLQLYIKVLITAIETLTRQIDKIEINTRKVI